MRFALPGGIPLLVFAVVWGCGRVSSSDSPEVLVGNGATPGEEMLGEGGMTGDDPLIGDELMSVSCVQNYDSYSLCTEHEVVEVDEAPGCVESEGVLVATEDLEGGCSRDDAVMVCDDFGGEENGLGADFYYGDVDVERACGMCNAQGRTCIVY